MTNQEEIRRGERAKQLLADPLIVEAFEAIEAEILLQWETSPTRDMEGKELIWQYYKTAKKFKAIFEGMVSSGNLASFREQQTITDKAVKLFKGKKNG